MTKPTINRRQLLGTAALGIAAVPLAGCTGVSRQDSQPHYVMVFDQNKCVGCGVCTTKCEFDAIHLKRVRPQNSKMIPAEDKFKAIGPYAAKRQVKIIKKSLAEKKK